MVKSNSYSWSTKYTREHFRVNNRAEDTCTLCQIPDDIRHIKVSLGKQMIEHTIIFDSNSS